MMILELFESNRMLIGPNIVSQSLIPSKIPRIVDITDIVDPGIGRSRCFIFLFPTSPLKSPSCHPDHILNCPSREARKSLAVLLP